METLKLDSAANSWIPEVGRVRRNITIKKFPRQKHQNQAGRGGAHPVYRVSSRAAKAGWWDPVWWKRRGR